MDKFEATLEEIGLTAEQKARIREFVRKQDEEQERRWREEEQREQEERRKQQEDDTFMFEEDEISDGSEDGRAVGKELMELQITIEVMQVEGVGLEIDGVRFVSEPFVQELKRLLIVLEDARSRTANTRTDYATPLEFTTWDSVFRAMTVDAEKTMRKEYEYIEYCWDNFSTAEKSVAMRDCPCMMLETPLGFSCPLLRDPVNCYDLLLLEIETELEKARKIKLHMTEWRCRRGLKAAAACAAEVARRRKLRMMESRCFRAVSVVAAHAADAAVKRETRVAWAAKESRKKDVKLEAPLLEKVEELQSEHAAGFMKEERDETGEGSFGDIAVQPVLPVLGGLVETPLLPKKDLAGSSRSSSNSKSSSSNSDAYATWDGAPTHPFDPGKRSARRPGKWGPTTGVAPPFDRGKVASCFSALVVDGDWSSVVRSCGVLLEIELHTT